MAAKNHIHKYHYINIGKRDEKRYTYACALPNCSHFIPIHMSKLVIGKESYCWQCGEKMIINKQHFRRKTRKPRCYKCTGKDVVKTSKPIPQGEQIKTEASIDLLLRMRSIK